MTQDDVLVGTRVVHDPYVTKFAGSYKVDFGKGLLAILTPCATNLKIGERLEPRIAPEHPYNKLVDD